MTLSILDIIFSCDFLYKNQASYSAFVVLEYRIHNKSNDCILQVVFFHRYRKRNSLNIALRIILINIDFTEGWLLSFDLMNEECAQDLFFFID